MSDYFEYHIYNATPKSFTFGLEVENGNQEAYIMVEGENLEYLTDDADIVGVKSGTVTKISIGYPAVSVSYPDGISVEQLNAYDPDWFGPTYTDGDFNEAYIVDFENIKSGAIIQHHQNEWEALIYDPATNAASSDADKTIFAHHEGGELKAEYKDSNDHLIGSAKDDQIYAGLDNDTLTGGAGEDTFHVALGSKWSDKVHATITDFQAGQDVLEISVDDSSVSSLDDLEIITKPEGTYIIAPNGNQITLKGISSLENLEINLTANPTPEQGAMDGSFETGSEFDDKLVGEFDRTDVEGKAGDDLIQVISGDDIFGATLAGGEGTDTIIGGNGNDTLYAGEKYGNGTDDNKRKSQDHLSGGEGDDKLIGGTLLEGGAGDDTLRSAGYGPSSILDGGTGDDILRSGYTGDWVIGGEGEDWLCYRSADEAVKATLSSANTDGVGHAKNDMVIGVENLRGTKYADELVGDDNDNVIDGGWENGVQYWSTRDTLTGGAGADTFMYGKGDIVTDFEDGVDRISLQYYSLYDGKLVDIEPEFGFSDLKIEQSGDSVLIGRPSTTDLSINGLVLENTDISQIDASDFIF